MIRRTRISEFLLLILLSYLLQAKKLVMIH